MQDVWRLVRQSPSIELASDAKTAIAECRTFLDELLDSDSSRVIYGVNTGFGDLAHTRVGASELGELQRNLLISHACGVGEDVPNAVVKAMLLLKIKALSQGHSGVRMETVERLIAHWNHRLFPVVPSQGSLGASGDLAPLSHMVLPLIGYGEVHVEGVAVPAHDVLKAKNWKPLKLEAKEGLALINGTQLMLGYGVMAMERLERIADWADALCAWSLEAWHGRVDAFDEDIHRIRKQPNAEAVARNVKDWLQDSRWQQMPREQVQDPYSFRCTPQVHGASRNSLDFARTVFENEINAVTDNPLIFPDSKKIVSGGNFHGQPLAMQLEALSLAAHEWGSISERENIQDVIGQAGLAAFLSCQSGIEQRIHDSAVYLCFSGVAKQATLCS